MRCASCGLELNKTGASCPRCDPTIVVTVPTEATTTGNPAPFATAQERFLPGAILSGRYRIVSLLGKGGMGEVYRADDLTLGQQVALKFLPHALNRNEDALRRFRNEVRVARQVSHPNVCRVHDVGEVEGQMFLSMEYVDGEDLASLLRRIGRLPETKALEIGRKLCAGLAAAHEKGVLHRDLKPGNIMLDSRGQVVLTDFGLAAVAAEIAGSEVRSGTPAYMAPEQLAGKEVTVRSDIYALGLVLYELFTGKRPFEAESLAELVQAREESSPASLTSHVRDLDPAIERVILRCLDADPARRPVSALAVSAGLPGGDPLAAALAAGETPSPEMVAAAGGEVAIKAPIAMALTAAILIAIAVHLTLTAQSSAHEALRPTQPPEVLQYKARELIRQLGYSPQAADSERGFAWGSKYIDWAFGQKPRPPWSDILRGRAPALRFWYRDSPYPLLGSMFHDDLLTMGQVRPDDPPPLDSGSRYIELDPEGRLVEFRAMPAEKVEAAGESGAGESGKEPDWSPLFQLADVDRRTFQEATPQWRFLEASDVRRAWTGVWPGSQHPLRVEAASLAGKPVVFVLLGPWATPIRMPPVENKFDWSLALLTGLGALLLATSVWLARINLLRGRGDRRGALRLGIFLGCVQLLLWASRVHLTPGFGLAGLLIVAIATATFFGVLVWVLYLALEPYVRRFWPTTIISSTRLLSGQFRDSMVGRDVLVGFGISCIWRLINHAKRISLDRAPEIPSEEFFTSARSGLSEVLENVPHAVRDSLLFFFLLFLLWMLLRRNSATAVAFTLIFTAIGFVSSTSVWDLLHLAVIYASLAAVTLRFGLLALACAILADGLIGDIPATFEMSAWYAPAFVLMSLTAVGLVLWALRQTTRGQVHFGELLR
ncbi:MAG: serine/threonine protein kinase [Bryobacteraceae bacterium]|nr:serine/threonine protein kinase [Bryobacteraceae bacterium]